MANEALEDKESTAVAVPSVFKGDTPFLTFSVEGKDVGKLWCTGGVLSFEGDCEKSAQVFFDNVIELNRSRLEA